MKLISRIHKFINKECMVELNAICHDRMISDNNKKADLMVEVLNKYKIPYKELGPGTNRYAVRIDGYVFKIAMDRNGIDDNRIEFTMSDELQPYVAKTYECNGLIAVSEYVTVISKSEFDENENNIKGILSQLAERYIFGDIGFTKKNFLNWGYRDNGDIVILDYGYIYKIIGEEARCTNLLSDDVVCGRFLEYDGRYSNLVCPHCRRKYSYEDIRRRIDLKLENERVDRVMKSAYCLTSDTSDFDVPDLEEAIDEEIGKEENTMRYEERELTNDELDDLYMAALERIRNPMPVVIENTNDEAPAETQDAVVDDDVIVEYDDALECPYEFALFDVVEVFGIPMLYTPDRITEKDNIPNTLSVFHVRDTDEMIGWESIEYEVFRLFAGSLLTAISFDTVDGFDDGIVKRIHSNSDYVFTGEQMTIHEYLEMIKTHYGESSIVEADDDEELSIEQVMEAMSRLRNDDDDEDDEDEYYTDPDDDDEDDEDDEEEEETTDDAETITEVVEDIPTEIVEPSAPVDAVEDAEELNDENSNPPESDVVESVVDTSADTDVNVSWIDPADLSSMREELAKLAEEEADDDSAEYRNKQYKRRKNY